MKPPTWLRPEAVAAWRRIEPKLANPLDVLSASAFAVLCCTVSDAERAAAKAKAADNDRSRRIWQRIRRNASKHARVWAREFRLNASTVLATTEP